jgi:hypothetical protein
MKIYVAQFQTASDLDDLRDVINDQCDVEFITCVPHLVSCDRDDLIARVMTTLRDEYIANADLDDDQTTPIEMPTDLMLVIDDAPDIDLMNARTVMCHDRFYAHIHITVHNV